MTDPNAPTVKAHRQAREHLERAARRRDAVLAVLAAAAPATAQDAAQPLTEPPTEGAL